VSAERTLEFAGALDCVRRRLPIFPCRGKNKPLTEHGFKDASCDLAQVTDWWGRWPEAAVAVATGPPSQLLVLDVDGEDGVAALAELERAHGPLPQTVSSVTPRGGRHYWFRYPDGPAVPCSAGKIGRGLDVRGDGGYVLLPPSKGPNGNRYTWHEPLGAAPIASAPDWLVELARADVRRSNGAAPPAGGAIPEGRRNDTLFRLACAMRRQGASEPAILAGLLERNKDCLPRPLPRREVERIAASGATYPPGATGGHRGAGPGQPGISPAAPQSLPAESAADAEKIAGNGSLSREPEALAQLFMRVRERRVNLPPEPEWVWQGYVAKGMVTLFPGKPKAGKSTLVCALSEALVSGADEFLGRRVATGPVVYVSEESAVTITGKLPGEVWLLDRETAWPRPGWSGLVHAAVAVAEREAAVLLVIDTFPYWAALPPDAEKDAGAVTEAMAELVGAVRHGLALVLVHHQRKGGGEELEGARGSGAIVGMPDAVIELERLGDGAPPNQRQLVAEARWPGVPGVLVIDRDPATGAYRVIGEGEDRADATGLAWRRRLLEALPFEDTLEEWPSYKELERQLGVKSKWLGALQRLRGEGAVRRTGPGVSGHPYRFAKSVGDGPATDTTDPAQRRDVESVGPYIDDGLDSQPSAVRRNVRRPTDMDSAELELERLRHKFPEGAT
jgi:hypothetical protein